MSDPLDILIPPVTSPIDLPTIEEPEGLENYSYDTSHHIWSCNICGSYVSSPLAHTGWHDQLLSGLDRDDTPR